VFGHQLIFRQMFFFVSDPKAGFPMFCFLFPLKKSSFVVRKKPGWDAKFKIGKFEIAKFEVTKLQSLKLQKLQSLKLQTSK